MPRLPCLWRREGRVIRFLVVLSGNRGGESVCQILRDVRERKLEILAIAHRHRASNIRVFGSVLTGGVGQTSDIDLLVTMAPGATLIDLIGLEQDLAELLGREVDVVSDDAVNPRMRDAVFSTAVPL